MIAEVKKSDTLKVYLINECTESERKRGKGRRRRNQFQ